MKVSETFISVTLIASNHKKLIAPFIRELCDYLCHRYEDYEVLIVDQSSIDGTQSEIERLLTIYPCIRYIRLNSILPDDVACAACIENAIGDFIVKLDIERDPIEIINDLVNQGKNGSDIVLGTSKTIATGTYRILRKMIHPITVSCGYTIPQDTTGLFCLSRRAVNSITELGKYHHRFYVRMANIGYPISSISYEIRHSGRKKNLPTGINQALHHLVFNSTKPLRWMSLLGFSGSALGVIFSLYSLIINIINEQVAQGWTTIVLFMSSLFSLLFLILAFFSEYIARLLNDREENKEYSVVFEKNSLVMVNKNRENVHFNSVSTDDNKTQTGRNK